MWFLNSIVSWLTSVEGFFYDAYLEVRGWVYPFYYLSYPLYSLYYAFYYLAYYFSSFNDWVDWAASRIADIISWENIKSLIRGWLPSLESAIDWFLAQFSWFTTQVTNWWAEVSVTVQGWIDNAKQELTSLINQLEALPTELIEAWDNFKARIPSIDEVLSWFTNWWSNTLASIIAWGALTATQIDTFIDTKIKDWFPFYLSLQQLWGKVEEFITDPEQWFYDRLETFFDRFW